MRIVLMYYVDLHGLFEHPESDRVRSMSRKKSYRNLIFWVGGLLKRKLTECNLFTRIERSIECHLKV